MYTHEGFDAWINDKVVKGLVVLPFGSPKEKKTMTKADVWAWLGKHTHKHGRVRLVN